jgi:hypothetical protein
MDKATRDAKTAIALLTEAATETDFLSLLVLCGDRQRRFHVFGVADQIAGGDLRGAEAVPPDGNQGAPRATLAVGRRHHLVEVAEESE